MYVGFCLTRKPMTQLPRLEGKSVKLMEPLDRDESDLSSIVFQVMTHIMLNCNIVLALIVESQSWYLPNFYY